MTPRPLRSLRNRKADQVYRQGGWGPLQSWVVPRGDEDPLVFQMRLPLTMDLVDIQTLADNAPGAPPAVTQGASEIAGVAETAGLILVGALREKAPDGAVEVLASMTVAFTTLSGLPSAEDLVPADAAGDVRPPEVEQLSEQATRITRLIAVVPPGQEEAVPNLSVQYLIASRYGAVSWTFATSRADMIFGAGGRDLFGKITETGYIGERPLSY